MKPFPGHFLAEVDYGSHEVRIIGSISGDPVLHEELATPDGDCHQQWADALEIKRDDSKNACVFPWFYGSYYKSIYYDLYNRGYTHLSMEDVQSVEHQFWIRYAGVKEWQDRLYRGYSKTGCVLNPFGFRRRGYLDRTKIPNQAIQSTAFHCLLWSYIKINRIRKKEYWESKMLGQIHDSIVLSVHPYEALHVLSTCKQVMEKDIMEEHSWITIPLIAEFDVTGVDGSWYDKRELTDISKVLEVI